MLTQQGTQRIEVIVRKEGAGAGETGNKTVTPDEDEKNTGVWSLLTGTTSKKKQRRVAITNSTHALAVAKQIFDLGIEYRIAGKGYQNGDQAYQDRVARVVERFKDTTNFASSVAMGAVYGAWGGPIGSVLGMALAAASTSASIASKYKGRDREYDYKMFQENNAIEYNRARAGVNLTNGRLR